MSAIPTTILPAMPRAHAIRLLRAFRDFFEDGGTADEALDLLERASRGSGPADPAAEATSVVSEPPRKQGEAADHSASVEQTERSLSAVSPPAGADLSATVVQTPPPVSASAKPNQQKPPSRSRLSAMQVAHKMLARTVFDSFILRDGRAIGDVPFSALDRLIADGRHETELLKLIRDRGIPPDPNTPIRELLSVTEMERLVQRAAEQASDHV